MLLLSLGSLCGQQITLVDVERVPADGDPAAALRTVTVPPRPREISCDLLVAGAGPGGIAAALLAAGRGHSVCLTEETDWIGGQITAGGVSALDENRFIEFSGGTRSYYEMRRRIRDYYRRRFQLAPDVAGLENFNPGACYVSPLCFEPRAGLQVLQDMLPHAVKLFLRTQIFRLRVEGGLIRSALAFGFESGEVIRFLPKFVLDATETGDLLPLAKVPYEVGSEPQSDTHEPHAAREPNPACVQSFTYTFAVEDRPGENHAIAKPPEYEKYRDRQQFSLRINYPVEYGWRGYFQYSMFGEDPPVPNNMSPRPFFGWRRLLAAQNFTGPNRPRDLALINWPRQDYAAESILDRSPLETAQILQRAKRTSLAFLYWLQTEVDGKGYPRLMLRKDVMGSADGLSKYPYIREARRLRTKERVVEQDIVDEYQQGPRARWFADSVGTGFYMVDIHPCGANERGRMMMPKPFQIPMGTLIPEGVANLLAAGKSLGVTHLTNGAFRLHPVEWNVGEAAGAIASLAVEKGALPAPRGVQVVLAKAGVPLVWFDDLPVSHPSFAAIQLAAIRGVYPLGSADLHASPDAPVTRAEAARALAAYFGRPLHTPEAVRMAIAQGWMATDHRNWFHPDIPFYWTDWREDRLPKPLAPLHAVRTGPVKRSELAERLQ
ncbi:MAG TPA: FAD-dependent oxidoreductase [Bryobacteraceae bacterium]|nr:FAD-dependent oxidoreductase [Bryobacteraceae bacterium]